MLGQKGITPGVIDALNKALNDHELIKMKFQDFKDQKKEVGKELAETTESHIIRTIGNILVLYRQQEDSEKRIYTLPG